MDACIFRLSYQSINPSQLERPAVISFQKLSFSPSSESVGQDNQILCQIRGAGSWEMVIKYSRDTLAPQCDTTTNQFIHLLSHTSNYYFSRIKYLETAEQKYRGVSGSLTSKGLQLLFCCCLVFGVFHRAALYVQIFTLI